MFLAAPNVYLRSLGLPLSPKTLIMDLRDALPVDGALKSFPGGAISDATLWACTTCHACVEACPVHIEHVPKIIQLRRNAIEEDRIPRGVQDALSNIGRAGNSMGKPAKMRARWTKDLPFRIKDAAFRPGGRFVVCGGPRLLRPTRPGGQPPVGYAPSHSRCRLRDFLTTLSRTA